MKILIFTLVLTTLSISTFGINYNIWSAIQNNDNISLTNIIINNKSIINLTNKKGQTPLILAYRENKLELVKSLIIYGADVNCRDNYGYTPLHISALYKKSIYLNYFNKNEELSNKIKYHNGIVELLISNGANVNSTNDNGDSPLHLASSHPGYIEVINILIKHGADINAINISGINPLYYAFLSGQNEIALVLIKSGAKLDLYTDEYGRNTLTWCCFYGNLDIVKYYINIGTNVNTKRLNGMSLLHEAAIGGHLNVVKYLSTKGANVKAIDNLGRSPLDCTLENRAYDVTLFLFKMNSPINTNYGEDMGGSFLSHALMDGQLEIAKYCLKNGFNVNAKLGYYSDSLLHNAVYGGHLNIIKYLISKNVDYNYINNRGWTPLDYAILYNKTNIINYLTSIGAKKGVNKQLLGF